MFRIDFRSRSRSSALCVALLVCATARSHGPPVAEGGADPANAAERSPLEARTALGRRLFFDASLSADGSVSCASCHQPANGWSSGRAIAPGVGGRLGRRHPPSLYNVGRARELFWDGRVTSLEALALMPIEHPDEMAQPLGPLLSRLEASPGVRERFASAGLRVDREGLASALAAFCRSITAADAPIDLYRQGDRGALSPAARRGHDVFYFRLNCASCHSGPDLTDGRFHNTGVGMDRDDPDLGRYAVTGESADRGAFRTPSLRNVAKTAPYMHDGRFNTLEEVVDFYVEGGIGNRHLDPLINVLPVEGAQKEDLVEFLSEALTSDADPAAEAAAADHLGSP